MTNLTTLEERVNVLEERLLRVESDKTFMDVLCKKAKEIVVKHQRTLAIFLQKKLLIDFERATNLVNRLKIEGVIKSEI